MLNPFNIPIVCDMSSDILTQNLNVKEYGLIFAGAQKNMGCAGVTIVIIREDLVGLGCKGLVTPIMLDYKTAVTNKSLYNTPSTFSVYVCGLVTKWGIQQGGLNALVEKSDSKSSTVYKCIERNGKIYQCCVQEKEYQSKVNIVFRILKNGKVCGDSENLFIKEAEKLGMIQLRGHRSVGGIRASIYNACPEEDVAFLVTFMNDFANRQRM